MRIANIRGRVALVVSDRVHDVEKASNGRFGPDPRGVLDDWEAFAEWARQASFGDDGDALAAENLECVVPRPTQVFAIGLNYRDHAAESGFDAPEGYPPVFTKFASALSAPNADVTIPPGGNVDWEVELVAVIGRQAHNIEVADAWSHVAGLTIGQDISERVLQLSGPAPQFSLGKSFANFAPVGPVLVSVDEFADPDDLAMTASINGETVQSGRTSQMIFSVSELISRLSKVVTFFPGDLIFTGTPAGVGLGRTPQRWLQDGDVLVSEIEGIGSMTQRFTAASE